MTSSFKTVVALCVCLAVCLTIRTISLAGCLGGCREAEYFENNFLKSCFLLEDKDCFNCGYCKTLVGDNTTGCLKNKQITIEDTCNWPNCAAACTGAPNDEQQEALPCEGIGDQVISDWYSCNVYPQ